MTLCPCDRTAFPVPPDIPPGLARLPRQIGLYPDFRASMLRRIGAHPALAGWRARDRDDIGLMLVEWWAQIADILAFYTAEHAQDLYLGTARDDAALRRVVALIGYRPRPGLAAEIRLAALVDGTETVTAPASAGVLSDAIDDTPPQRFELTADTPLDPARNAWTLAPIRDATYDPARLLIDPASRNLAEDALLVLDADGTRAALRVAGIAAETGLDRQPVLRVTVTVPEDLPAGGAPLSATRLWAFAQSAPVTGRDGATLSLSGLFPQLRRGELVAIEDTDATAPAAPEVRTLTAIAAEQATLLPADSGTGSPAVTAPATRVTLSAASAIPADRARLHFGRVRAGRLVAPPRARIAGADLVGGAPLEGRHPAPDLPGRGEVLLQGARGAGRRIAGDVAVDPDSGAATLIPGGAFTAFPEELRTPVAVHGNLMTATRGQTVEEVLGSGQGAAAPFARFPLARAPLTYLRDAAAPSGRRSTLALSVDGVVWQEVDSLFFAGPEDRVYTVDLDAEGAATVTFGDGVHGLPPPAGTDNIRATYRFGGGEPAPGPGQVTQLAGPVPRLRRVFNPTAGFGGQPGDRPEDIRFTAPLSAASFGRAVSASDFAALARDWGAFAATAVARWLPDRQSVGVEVTAIFDGPAGPDALDALAAHLRARAAEMLPIVVRAATPETGELRLSYRSTGNPETVRAALRDSFEHPFTGVFSPRRALIGGPVFRSAILGRAAAVPGVASLSGLTWRGQPAPPRLPLPALGYLAPTLTLEDSA